MDRKYLFYSATEFAGDESFLAWRLQGDPEAAAFWNAFIEQYPGKQDEIAHAVGMVDSLRMNDVCFSAEEMRDDMARLRTSISRSRSRRRVGLVSAAAAAVLMAVAGVTLYNIGVRTPEKAIAALQNRNDNHIRLERAGSPVAELDNHSEITYDEYGNINLGSLALAEQPGLKSAHEGVTDRLIVPGGKRLSVTLPDNSRVWINAGTTIEYASSLSGPTREVTVNGEVYVEVERDENRPFIIHTSRMSVRVLGTSFNVSAYRDDEQSSVVLVNGLVEVATAEGRSVSLTPDDMLTVTDGGMQLSKVDANDHISWKDGVLRFSGRPLDSVLAYLSRYYDVPVEAHGTEGITITGTLILFDSLDTVLENFTVIAPVNYTADREKVTVTATHLTK